MRKQALDGGYAMDLTCSVATEKDIVFINEVYHENIESLHGANRTQEAWKPLLEKPEHAYYIVSAEKAVAWFRTDVEDGGFWLGMLQVKPMYHRQGIGKYILSVAEAIAKEGGYKKLGIHTTEDNLAARALYLSAGYAVTEIGPCTTGDGKDRVGYTFCKEIAIG